MKTAVEWLEDKIINERRVILNDENYRLFKKAKKMEKQQFEKAFNKGLITENVYYGYDDNKSEQYYNETFKK